MFLLSLMTTDMDLKGKSGENLLMVAVKYHQVDNTGFLLEHNINLWVENNFVDNVFDTVLEERCDEIEILQTMLNALKRDDSSNVLLFRYKFSSDYRKRIKKKVQKTNFVHRKQKQKLQKRTQDRLRYKPLFYVFSYDKELWSFLENVLQM